MSDPGGFTGESREVRMLIQISDLTRERNEALRHLEIITEDCDGWLNNQCDETAVEFIKAVRDYARKVTNA